MFNLALGVACAALAVSMARTTIRDQRLEAISRDQASSPVRNESVAFWQFARSWTVVVLAGLLSVGLLWDGVTDL